MSDLLIVGGGLAAATVVRALRQRGDQRSITMLCAEDREPYDRPPLSKDVLTGALELAATRLRQDAEDWQVDLRIGEPAVALAPDDLVVQSASGLQYRASDIVIATGAHPRTVPGFGAGVHYLRTAADAERLRSALEGASSVVIIGAGFIGLEVAASARQGGASVTVVEAAPNPLARVLGPEAGALISRLHRDRGVDLRCGATVSHADGSRVVLEGGEEFAADAVVVGIGVLPATQWLDGSGVFVDNGVLCDGSGRTSRPRVWAAGDVARWPNAATGLHVRVEQWQAALDQAQLIAANLAGESAVWTSVPYFWSDQFDTKIQFAGHAGDHGVVLGEGVIAYADEAAATGLLVLDNPRLLARGRRIIAQRGSVDDLAALLA